MKKEEYLICKAFWYEFQLRYPKLVDMDCLINIEPGGHKLTDAQKSRIKAIGIRRGIADYLLKIARGKYASLWIEFKTLKGTQSPGQKIFEKLAAEGRDKYVVCRSAEEGIATVKDYLNLDSVVATKKNRKKTEKNQKDKQQVEILKQEIDSENLNT